MVVIGIVGFVCAGWGLVKLGAKSRTAQKTDEAPRADYSHVYWLLGVLLVAGIANDPRVRSLVTPESYGEFGYYRGDAAREARAGKIQHQGKEVCRQCHPDIPKAHAKDMHSGVQCETCHGAAADHLAHFERKGLFGPKAIFVPKTREPCLWCHRRLEARPSTFPQINPDEHYAFLGVGDLARWSLDHAGGGTRVRQRSAAACRGLGLARGGRQASLRCIVGEVFVGDDDAFAVFGAFEGLGLRNLGQGLLVLIHFRRGGGCRRGLVAER